MAATSKIIALVYGVHLCMQTEVDAGEDWAAGEACALFEAMADSLMDLGDCAGVDGMVGCR